MGYIQARKYKIHKNIHQKINYKNLKKWAFSFWKILPRIKFLTVLVICFLSGLWQIWFYDVLALGKQTISVKLLVFAIAPDIIKEKIALKKGRFLANLTW